MNRNPIINTPHQGRTIAVVGDVYRFLATGEETDGKYALFEAIVPPPDVVHTSLPHHRIQLAQAGEKQWAGSLSEPCKGFAFDLLPRDNIIGVGSMVGQSPI